MVELCIAIGRFDDALERAQAAHDAAPDAATDALLHRARDAALAHRLDRALDLALDPPDPPRLESVATEVLAGAHDPALRSSALDVLCVGCGLAGAPDRVLDVVSDDDPSERVRACMFARSYDRAEQRVLRERADTPEQRATNAATIERIRAAQAQWNAAIAQLSATCVSDRSAVDHALVREAGARTKRDADAAVVGEAMLADGNDPDLAFEVARCWARAGRADAAIAALGRAVAGGFRNWEAVDHGAEFDLVRTASGWATRWSQLRNEGRDPTM
jgi:hypothetical protein